MKITKKTLYYASICISMTSLTIFTYIFILLLFIPSISIVLYEFNVFIVIIELLICIIGLFGLILLCMEMVNNGK